MSENNNENVDISKILEENKNLKLQLEKQAQAPQPTTTQQNNPYEDYLKNKEEAETNKKKEDILLNEFSNMSFLYSKNFLDATERMQKMGAFSLGEKIEQMAIDTIIKAFPNEETRNKINELKDISVLDSKGAKNFLYFEALKKLKEVAELPTVAGGKADYNRLTTGELKDLSQALFNGATKEQAKLKAKNYGLI